MASKVQDRSKLIQSLKVRLSETLVKIDKLLPMLEKDNLKHVMEKFGLTESETYGAYARYKILVLISVAQQPEHNMLNGLLKGTFIEGVKGNANQDA